MIRVIPRAEREECINTGVLLHVVGEDQRLEVRLSDRWRLAYLIEPSCDMSEMRAQLAALVAVAQGASQSALGEELELAVRAGEALQVAHLSAGERFHWLSAVRSAVVRCSPAHIGRGSDVSLVIEQILERSAPALNEEQRALCDQLES